MVRCQADDDVHVIEVIQPVQIVEQGDVMAKALIGPAVLDGSTPPRHAPPEVLPDAADKPGAPDQYLHVPPPDGSGSTLEPGCPDGQGDPAFASIAILFS